MAELAADNASIESRADVDDGPDGEVRFYLTQLKLAETEDKSFIERGRKIVKRYRDERPASTSRSGEARFNILWSNVETLKPILYGRTPKPDVERRHKNDDPISRLGRKFWNVLWPMKTISTSSMR
jgi:hypothetical protein